MNNLPASFRSVRTTLLTCFWSVLLTFAALVSSASAQSKPVKFVAPQRLRNAEGVPDGAYKAVAGHFHSTSRLDIAFTGISFEFTTPHEFRDITLNQGAGSFGVISSNPGAGDINIGPDLAADLNRDGLTDLVSFASNGFNVQFAIGDGTFANSPATVPVDSFNSGVTSMVAADFDGNGTMDLAALTSRNTVVILLNDGHGVFHRAFTYAAPNGAATSGAALRGR